MCTGHVLKYQGCGHAVSQPTKLRETNSCNELDFESNQSFTGVCKSCEQPNILGATGNGPGGGAGSEGPSSARETARRNSAPSLNQATKTGNALGARIREVSTFQQGYQLQALKERVKSLELMVAQVPGIQAEQEKIINGKVTRLEKAATINFTTTLGLAFRKLEDHVTDVNIAKQSILTARIAALQEQLDGSQQANTGAKKTYGTNDPIIREAVSEWDDMVRAHFSEIKAETVWQIEELAKSFLTSLV